MKRFLKIAFSETGHYLIDLNVSIVKTPQRK